MKPDKFLCCGLLFCFFGLDRAHKTIVYFVLRNKAIETFWLCSSCIVYERKTKDCAQL